MKKIISCLLILTSFLWMIGCSETKMKNFQYKVQSMDSFESAEGKNLPPEVSLWDGNGYQDESYQNQQKEVQTSLFTMKGEYQQSQIRMYEYFPTHRYSGEGSDHFTVDSDGNLVGFVRLPEEDAPTDSACSEEECLAIAKDFFATMVEDADAYQITTQYQESIKVYYFYFVKYVGSFPTADQAIIGVTSDSGFLYMYKAIMLGKMDAHEKVEIDRSKADQAMTERLEKALSEKKGQHDEARCDGLSYTLTKNENQYILICDAEIKLIDYDEEGTLESVELLRFILT